MTPRTRSDLHPYANDVYFWLGRNLCLHGLGVPADGGDRPIDDATAVAVRVLLSSFHAVATGQAAAVGDENAAAYANAMSEIDEAFRVRGCDERARRLIEAGMLAEAHAVYKKTQELLARFPDGDPDPAAIRAIADVVDPYVNVIRRVAVRCLPRRPTARALLAVLREARDRFHRRLCLASRAMRRPPGPDVPRPRHLFGSHQGQGARSPDDGNDAGEPPDLVRAPASPAFDLSSSAPDARPQPRSTKNDKASAPAEPERGGAPVNVDAREIRRTVELLVEPNSVVELLCSPARSSRSPRPSESPIWARDRGAGR